MEAKNLLPLLLLLSLASAALPFESPLDAQIRVEEKVLSSKLDNVTVSAYIANNEPVSYRVRLMYEEGPDWAEVRDIGELEPYGALNATITIHLAYEGHLRKVSRYALVAASPFSTKGKDFEIVEDWSGYRSQISQYLSAVSLSIVPIIVVFILTVLSMVVMFAMRHHAEGAFPGEFTTATLFFPRMGGRPFEEKIADLFITPFFWAIEIASFAILLYVMVTNTVQTYGDGGGLPIFVLSGIGAFLMPLFYLIMAYYLESYTQKPLRFFAGLFVWGMYASFFALLANSTFLSGISAVIPPEYYVLITAVLIAPLIEETLKGIGVYLVSGHHEYNNMLTGLLFGFTAGVGFSFVENWFYFTSRTNPFDVGIVSWAGLILYRSFFNSIAHGCFTAATGALIGYLKATPKYASFGKFGIVPGIFLATILHSIFNTSALADGFVIANREFPIYIFNPVAVLVLAVLFIAAFAYSKGEAGRRAGGPGETKRNEFS